jgi:hypothetical protein
MGKVKTVTISHTLSGTSGNTTTETTHQGKILAVEIDYPANTVTVDIDAVNTVGTDEKILNLAAANTDTKVYPRVQVQDNTGSDLDLSDSEGGDTKVYDYFVINGKLKLSLASGTDEQTVTVRVFLED